MVLPLGHHRRLMDPHEIANVLGLDGIRYMLESAARRRLSVYMMLPSCVPATDMETSRRHLTAHDITTFFGEHPQVLGLAEMMNYPGVIFRATRGAGQDQGLSGPPSSTATRRDSRARI